MWWAGEVRSEQEAHYHLVDQISFLPLLPSPLAVVEPEKFDLLGCSEVQSVEVFIRLVGSLAFADQERFASRTSPPYNNPPGANHPPVS